MNGYPRKGENVFGVLPPRRDLGRYVDVWLKSFDIEKQRRRKGGPRPGRPGEND